MSEWITNRLPTDRDSDILKKVWITENGFVYWADYTTVEVNQPWMPIKEPDAYIKPSVEPDPWKPKTDQSYWAVEHTGVILLQWTGNNSDMSYYHSRNCFQTEAQAQEAARRVRELLLNYHKELNNAE
jgi:hypothetical protein